jgi:hypothetical protein
MNAAAADESGTSSSTLRSLMAARIIADGVD